MASMTSASPELLRAKFRDAKRLPALLEVAEATRAALRQVSDQMDENEDGNGNGGGNSELQALFAMLKSLLDQITEKIQRTATLDDLTLRQAGTPIGMTGDRAWDQQQAEFSITRAIAAALGSPHGFNVDAARERETSQELARRSGISPQGILVPLAALSVRARDATPAQMRAVERRVVSTTTPAAGPGGSLIMTAIDPQQYIDVLRPQMAVRQLGARVLSGLTSNLNLPAMTMAASSEWFAENTAIGVVDEQFGDVQLRPRHCGAIVEISRNMLQQASPDIETIVRNDLAAVLARGVDGAAIQGAGGTEPLGIVTDGNVASLPVAPPTYDLLIDLSSLLATKNALEGSLGWLADANARGLLLKLKDQYARPYGLDLLFQGFPYAFSNLAVGVTGKLDPIIFANWADLVIGMWSELDLLVNPYDSAAYSKGNVLVRGAMTIDIAKRHVESFSWMATAP